MICLDRVKPRTLGLSYELGDGGERGRLGMPGAERREPEVHLLVDKLALLERDVFLQLGADAGPCSRQSSVA